MEIILQIQEIYPNLDRLMVDNIDDPTFITITTEENTDQEMYEEIFVDEEDEEFEAQLNLLEWKDDDDDSGGFLQ